MIVKLQDLLVCEKNRCKAGCF